MSRYTTGWLTTFVAATSSHPSDPEVPPEVQDLGNGSAVVRLSVAVVACEGEAGDDPSGMCEVSRLDDALQQLTAFDDFEADLNSAGGYACMKAMARLRGQFAPELRAKLQSSGCPRGRD